MRNIIIAFIALTMFSCERMIENDSNNAPAGNLSVHVERIEKTTFDGASRAEASEYCKRLCFAVYNEDGTRQKQINQKAGDSDFGTADFQLQTGEYLLVVVGHSSEGNPTMTKAEKIQFTNATGYTDTFLYAKSFTISDDNPISMDIGLDRIAALCRFQITDNIPTTVKKMWFQYTGGSGAFEAATGMGCVNSTQTVTFDVGSGQKQYDLYTFPHEETGTIHLLVKALDAREDVITEQAYDIPVERNAITWFSGDFFSGKAAQTGGVKVSVNGEWGKELHLSF